MPASASAPSRSWCRTLRARRRSCCAAGTTASRSTTATTRRSGADQRFRGFQAVWDPRVGSASMATTLESGPERPPTAPIHRRPARRAPWPVEFYRSAVGKKWVMAISGLLLIGFVFFHALGNLKVYFGADDFNHYGEWLREILVPFLPRTVFLWIMRIGLIAAFAFHIHSAYSLTRMNGRARGGGYVQERDFKE